MYSKYLIKMGFLELARRRHWILIALRIWRSDQAAPKMNLKETQASVGTTLTSFGRAVSFNKNPNKTTSEAIVENGAAARFNVHSY